MNKIFILVLVFAVVSCTQENPSRTDTLPFYHEASFTPIWLDPQSDSVQAIHKIPAFELVNQDGELVTESTFDDKIYVVDFFFTSCPGICPRMTKNMYVLQEEFLEDDAVLFLSHSVMPTQDSVSVLKHYAENQGVVSGKWHLVTGERDKIYNLGRRGYFVEEDLGLERSPEVFLHTENFVLIDKNKHIRGIYNGLNMASVQQLVADIRTLEREM